MRFAVASERELWPNSSAVSARARASFAHALPRLEHQAGADQPESPTKPLSRSLAAHSELEWLRESYLELRQAHDKLLVDVSHPPPRSPIAKAPLLSRLRMEDRAAFCRWRERERE